MQSKKTAYRNLANAIILQAVADYRNALKGISYNNYPPEAIIKEVEIFFRSRWYRELTNIDAEYLIERLQKQHNERQGKEQI